MNLFTPKGRAIYPRPGQIVPAGTIVEEYGKFRVLERDSVFERLREHDETCQRAETTKNLREVVR